LLSKAETLAGEPGEKVGKWRESDETCGKTVGDAEKNAGTCGTIGDMWENGWRNNRNMSEKAGKMTKSVAITVVPWSSDPIGKVFRCRGSAQP